MLTALSHFTALRLFPSTTSRSRRPDARLHAETLRMGRAKWVKELKFPAKDRPGFRERNGDSNTADPWLEERYRE
jgi:hypothetical protein